MHNCKWLLRGCGLLVNLRPGICACQDNQTASRSNCAKISLFNYQLELTCFDIHHNYSKAIQVLCFDIHHQQLSQTPAGSYLPACRLLNRVSSPEDHQSQPFHQNSWRDIFVEKFCGFLLLITKSVQYDFVEITNIPTPCVT